MNDVDVLIRSHGNSRFLLSAIDSVQKQVFAGRYRIHVSIFESSLDLLIRLEEMSSRDQICLHKCDRAGYAYPLNLMIGCGSGR